MGILVAAIGLAIVVIGVVGAVQPRRVIDLAAYWTTPERLTFTAALRVGLGIILIGSAPVCDSPGLVRTFGVLLVVAGVATPFVGADRVKGMVDWFRARDDRFIRIYCAVPILLGLWLIAAGT